MTATEVNEYNCGLLSAMNRVPSVVGLVFLLLIEVTPSVFAQENLHFSVDRPGISDYPTIVPKGWLQLETGLEWYQHDDHRSLLLPTMLVRTAISKRIEVRMTNRFLRVDSVHEANPHDTYFYYGSAEIKALLIREKGLRPATAVMAGYSLTPATVQALKGLLWGNNIMLLMENNLHDQVIFNYNIGYIWNGYSGKSSAMYSFTFEIELSTVASIFIEQSSFYNHGEKDDHWINLGYTHLEAKHSQFDFSMGLSFNGGSQDYFFAVGYSTRIALRKELN